MSESTTTLRPILKEHYMPASEVMPKFKKHKLHSGSKHGPVVTNPKQAKAIQISEARAEGYHIPKPDGHGRSKAITKLKHRSKS